MASGLSTTATTFTGSGVKCTLSNDGKPSHFSFALEAGPLVDPLNDGTLSPEDRQPWRLSFEVIEEQKVKGSEHKEYKYEPVKESD